MKDILNNEEDFVRDPLCETSDFSNFKWRGRGFVNLIFYPSKEYDVTMVCTVDRAKSGRTKSCLTSCGNSRSFLSNFIAVLVRIKINKSFVLCYGYTHGSDNFLIHGNITLFEITLGFYWVVDIFTGWDVYFLNRSIHLLHKIKNNIFVEFIRSHFFRNTLLECVRMISFWILLHNYLNFTFLQSHILDWHGQYRKNNYWTGTKNYIEQNEIKYWIVII